MQCDAIKHGLGSTLPKKRHCFNHTYTDTESVCTNRKECLAIEFGCEKFKQFLLRRDKETEESDHNSLQSIFKKLLLSAPSRLQILMMLRLQPFNLEVVYKPGKQMHIVDRLSLTELQSEDTDESNFTVFTIELENITPINTAVKISGDKLSHLQKATEPGLNL